MFNSIEFVKLYGLNMAIQIQDTIIRQFSTIWCAHRVVLIQSLICGDVVHSKYSIRIYFKRGKKFWHAPSYLEMWRVFDRFLRGHQLLGGGDTWVMQEYCLPQLSLDSRHTEDLHRFDVEFGFSWKEPLALDVKRTGGELEMILHWYVKWQQQRRKGQYWYDSLMEIMAKSDWFIQESEGP